MFTRLKSLPWLRIVIGGVLIEALNIVFLYFAVYIYSTRISPGLTQADYEKAAVLIGSRVIPRTGLVVSLLVGMWSARKEREGKWMAGGLAAAVSVLVDLLLGGRFASVELRSYGERILGGVLGGVAGGSALWKASRTRV